MPKSTSLYFSITHTIFFLTTLIAMGILLQYYKSTAFLFPIIGICLYLRYKFNKNIRLIPLIICFTAILIGAIRYEQQQNNHTEFYRLIGNDTFSGKARVCNIEPMEHLRFKYRITFQFEKIKKLQQKEWKFLSNKIQVCIPYKPPIRVGDFVQVNNLIQKKLNNSSFDNYLIKEGLAGSFFLSTLDFNLIERPSICIARWLHNYKQNIFYSLKRKCSFITFSLFSSAFLGNRKTNKQRAEQTKQQFKLWGIFHYLARSGLHLIIVILVWTLLLSLIPFPWLYKHIITFSLVIIYCALSWTSLSFIRAFVTFILYRLCTIISVQINFLHLLTLVCLGLLLYNPIQLFFLDFQLSFGLTFALAWFNYVQSRKKTLLKQNY